jgi:circadian clock protein KaiC
MDAPMNEARKLELERVPTGVPGLDKILRGGLLRGSVYIVEGAPGAGKTILANQICFNHVADGGGAVFVTLLAESHVRMMQHLRPMSFFDESVIPDRLYYVSGFAILETDGLKGIVDLIRREIKGHKATMLVLDGFGVTEEAASSEREFKKFVHDIQSHAAAADCTVLLLTNGSVRRMEPEYTMVDGVLHIDDSLIGQRAERSLQVRKFRGSGGLRGKHQFRITERGLVVFPRVEAAYATPSTLDEYKLRRTTIGVKGVDDMLSGGLLAETSNGVFGPTGAGKTTLGIQFVAAGTPTEPALFFGLYEHPERLRAKAKTMSIDLPALEKQRAVEIIWRPQGEQLLDELGNQLIDAVHERRFKRVCIDGFGGLMQSAAHPERITSFVSTLGNELRAQGATVLLTMETRDVLGSSMQLPIDGMSSLLEGLLNMRYVEVQGELRRLIAITKLRDSDFDGRLHDFNITSRGIQVGEPFRGLEALLSGHARKPRANAPNAGARKRTRKGKS